MNLHIDEFTEGVHDILELYKQGNNIFEMKSGSLFPHHTSQKTWQYARDDSGVHFSDGTNTYSFKGQLNEMDTQLEKMPDVPWPDLYAKAKEKGKAQIHRSDPGSIYFTLQEGRHNPTYTLKHEGDSKWKAIPKPRKTKIFKGTPMTPPNVNLEGVKEGMFKELEEITKEAEGLFDSAGHSAVKGLEWLANLPGQLAMFPARMTSTMPGGNPVTYFNDPNINAAEDLNSVLRNAALAGGVGAGAGGLYHLAKRNLLNTEEENRQEDEEGGKLFNRMAIPGGVMAGMNVVGRQALPRAVNNPELKMFPPE
jgi:hypothetical protein